MDSGRTIRMNASQVIDRLRAHEPELRERGIKSLTLFGSTARKSLLGLVRQSAERDFLLAIESR